MADWLEEHRLRLRAEAEAERARAAAEAEIERNRVAYCVLRAREFGKKYFSPLEGRMTRLGPLTHAIDGTTLTFSAGGTTLGRIEFALGHADDQAATRWPVFSVGGLSCRARDTWTTALKWVPLDAPPRSAGHSAPFHEAAVPAAGLPAGFLVPVARPSSLGELAEYLLNFLV